MSRKKDFGEKKEQNNSGEQGLAKKILVRKKNRTYTIRRAKALEKFYKETKSQRTNKKIRKDL